MAIKDWWISRSPSVRRASVGLSKAFLWSIVLILCAYAAIWFRADNHGPDWNAGRLATFIDAVLAGILAFAMLGVFTFLVSVKRPEEERLDERIAFLFSARGNGSDQVTKYLQEQVMLLGAVAKYANFKISLLETSTDRRHVKVLMQTEMRIVNMMMHDAYRQKMPLKIGISKLENWNQDLGSVISASTQSFDQNGLCSSAVTWINKPYRLTNHSPKMEMDVMLDIPPSGELYYKYSVESWSTIEDGYLCRANRFAEKINIEIQNECDAPVDCLPFTLDGMDVTVDNPMTAPSHDSLSFMFTGIPPSQRVAFTLALRYNDLQSEESPMKGIDTTGG